MKKPKFVLSRKNQKGQVAIFVALIFQVIFVFFALLVNVGLLVHHKINLQQSTDLAAYYGAMKQAESLNAIGHINYQIRQAWKLLTWRYRVVGSFGFVPWSGSTSPQFPLKFTGPNGVGVVNSSASSDKCEVPLGSGVYVNTADVPFFCATHAGVRGWPGTTENNCKFSCDSIRGAANTISKIPNVSGGVAGYETSTAGAINTAISAANDSQKQLCEALGPANVNLLGNFLVSYYIEEKARSETLLMLAANLSNQESEKVLDLDGNLILDGVKKTLKNNLTEANATSMADGKIKVINGLSNQSCRISPDINTAAAKASDGQFLKRIEFSLVQLYMQSCVYNNASFYQPRSIFDSNLAAIDPSLKASTALNNIVMNLEAKVNHRFSVGYEKDPWCESYYTVKAESEPKIPFLPISKIKLTAISSAKPFGGSVGPWFGKEWKSGDKNTQDAVGIDVNKQTDPTLPLMTALPATASMKDNAKITLNFSRFVGDTEGLSDPKYLAQFHAALIDRQPSSGTHGLGGSKSPDTSGDGKVSVPAVWPSFASWKDSILDITDGNYDPMMKEENNRDSYLRDLEIAAIAPNQFDLTYYSIEPDFYDNYYRRISNPTIFAKLKDSAGIGPNSVTSVRPDFGNNPKVYSSQANFSVRNQIQVVAKIFKQKVGSHIIDTESNFLNAYPEIAQKQASLLTGWTFFSLSDFDKFPDADVNTPEGVMTFGRCKDPWHGSDGSGFKSPSEDGDTSLPPTPGNCVTGGRVGYSVKLVSPSLLREGANPQPYGGASTSGPIKNPIPESFFSF